MKNKGRDHANPATDFIQARSVWRGTRSARFRSPCRHADAKLINAAGPGRDAGPARWQAGSAGRLLTDGREAGRRLVAGGGGVRPAACLAVRGQADFWGLL
jgi:hypothetical protein